MIPALLEMLQYLTEEVAKMIKDILIFSCLYILLNFSGGFYGYNNCI